MSSRSLADLLPEFRALVEPALADCAAAGIDVLVTCTLRSNDEQATLFAQGRTAPGPIVTNARPGQSAHNFGLGLDVVPIVNGKPDWSGTTPVWQEIANIFRARGCQWLGEPDSPFREQAHFQLPGWQQHVTTT